MQIREEELSFHPINDPSLHKRKENANDSRRALSWNPSRIQRLSHSTKKDSDKDNNNLEATKNMNRP